MVNALNSRALTRQFWDNLGSGIGAKPSAPSKRGKPIVPIGARSIAPLKVVKLQVSKRC
jgi:hypothetical protein